MVHPLDEHPIHQAPLSMAQVATSDRNAYDRCILHVIDPSGEVLLLTGLGVYPNLGVMDGYACLRRGTEQLTVRTSDALDDQRLELAVGPLRCEVVDPLKELRIVSEHPELSYDLTWTAVSPAFEEPLHTMTDSKGRTTLIGCRFGQSGSWSGSIRTADGEIAVDGWPGTRDRSWGIRPVGEPEPAGRPQQHEGFWWLWIPLRFQDYTIMTVVQEDVHGFRRLNDAIRVWHDGRKEQLGWPEVDITYRSGTRHPERAVLRFRDGYSVEVETLTAVALNVGCGYGGDPDWQHGTWQGEDWTEVATYDLTDEAVLARMSFGVVDHAAKATASDGEVGYGIFEHASMGRHDPTGFADWSSMAP